MDRFTNSPFVRELTEVGLQLVFPEALAGNDVICFEHNQSALVLWFDSASPKGDCCWIVNKKQSWTEHSNKLGYWNYHTSRPLFPYRYKFFLADMRQVEPTLPESEMVSLMRRLPYYLLFATHCINHTRMGAVTLQDFLTTLGVQGHGFSASNVPVDGSKILISRGNAS